MYSLVSVGLFQVTHHTLVHQFTMRFFTLRMKLSHFPFISASTAKPIGDEVSVWLCRRIGTYLFCYIWKQVVPSQIPLPQQRYRSRPDVSYSGGCCDVLTVGFIKALPLGQGDFVSCSGMSETSWPGPSFRGWDFRKVLYQSSASNQTCMLQVTGVRCMCSFVTLSAYIMCADIAS